MPAMPHGEVQFFQWVGCCASGSRFLSTSICRSTSCMNCPVRSDPVRPCFRCGSDIQPYSGQPSAFCAYCNNYWNPLMTVGSRECCLLTEDCETCLVGTVPFYNVQTGAYGCSPCPGGTYSY